MHDKQIRRRRAVLALVVGISLILLTAYFGESPSSPLHSVQRGVVEILSPIQEGASKVLKPVRDIAGWFSDTFHAKSEVAKLQKQVAYYRAQAAQAELQAVQNQQLRTEVGLDNRIGVAAYKPVGADVISRDPQLWYATIEIDRGADDGVHVGDPVLGDGALVGKVTMAAPTVAFVTLITDHASAVTAEVVDQHGDAGVLVPAVGNPNALLLTYVIDRHAPISQGQQVVTAGFHSGALDSLFPPGIPIGTVSDANPNNLLSNGQVTVSPDADLRHLTSVQVLTAPHASNVRAQLPSG